MFEYEERIYFVYILLCADRSYYVGVTNNIERRLVEHHEGLDKGCYTYTRRPLECVYVEEFGLILEAIAREKQLKRWSRKKKEALIRGDEVELRYLSKHYMGKHYDWRENKKKHKQ